MGLSAVCVASPPPVSAMSDDRQRDEPERGAEPREQVVARLGALPHLHQRAVGEADGPGFERRDVPALRLAQDDRLHAAVHDAHEEPLGRGLLLGLDGGRQPVEAAAIVRRRVEARACCR